MKIQLNNREVVFETSNLTIAKIIELQKFTYKRLVVRLNNVVVKHETQGDTPVNEGDVVEIIHLMAGG